MDGIPQDDTLLILGTSMHMLVHMTMKSFGLVSLVSMALEYAIWLVKINFNFFEINQLSVMNSFYKKKYYSTWTHPGTKICHMIDFVIMKTSQINCLWMCR